MKNFISISLFHGVAWISAMAILALTGWCKSGEKVVLTEQSADLRALGNLMGQELIIDMMFMTR